MKKKPLIIAGSIIFAFIFALVVVNNYKTKTSFKYDNMSAQELKPQKNTQDAIQKEVIKEAKKANIADQEAINDKAQGGIQGELLKESSKDIVLGNKNAPITIIEYASLSCPHCAYFARDAFPQLKNEYIDKGLVKFIFRDFPLNQHALTAGIIAKCHARNNPSSLSDKYYNFLKILFKSQDSWAFDKNFVKKLEIVAKMDGITQEQFKACLDKKEISDEILKGRMKASKELEIKSTPTFFINGVTSSGYTDYIKIKNIIETELSKTK